MKKPQPRGDAYYGDSGETWLEPEKYCYPNGGKTRRARVDMGKGKYRVLRCGVPDTFFSVPVSKQDADGFIVLEEGGYRFIKHGTVGV